MKICILFQVKSDNITIWQICDNRVAARVVQIEFLQHWWIYKIEIILLSSMGNTRMKRMIIWAKLRKIKKNSEKKLKSWQFWNGHYLCPNDWARHFIIQNSDWQCIRWHWSITGQFQSLISSNFMEDKVNSVSSSKFEFFLLTVLLKIFYLWTKIRFLLLMRYPYCW